VGYLTGLEYLLMRLVVDGVCSVASEELNMEEWGIDVVLTASQKGLGTPPGLSVLCASPRAMEVCILGHLSMLWSDVSGRTQVYHSRKAKPTSYYASWKKWLPIMQNYEKGTASYFATPPGENKP
jgi:alanine-glyoxylate transaminase/serine-glyoxylate transaminase/serine-pyruvate transaminase